MIETGNVPECVDCGVCCFSTAKDYLRVAGADYERLGDVAASLTLSIENRTYMRIVDGHCVALTYEPIQKKFLCSVYERRPDVCHWLERGSGNCLGEISTKSERPQTLVQLSQKP